MLISTVSSIQRIQLTSYLDLYGKAMSSFLPTGAGFFYEQQDNGSFLWHSLLRKTPEWSWDAISWLNYLQDSDKFKNVNIRHA